MALCSQIDNNGQVKPCEPNGRLFHQIQLEKCHMPCRKKFNQVGKTFILSADDGIPELPTMNVFSQKCSIVQEPHSIVQGPRSRVIAEFKI